MLDAYIYDGLRTPFGRHAGGLAPVRPDDLLAMVIKSLMARSAFKAQDLDDVIMGCANQAGEDSRNIARHAGLLAGLPIEVPAMVTQRLCASGLQAITSAAHAMSAKEAQLILAGGVESMSRAVFVMNKAESAYSKDVRIYDSALGARFPNPKIEAAYGDDTMPQTADNLAREFNLSRQACDAFAERSQSRYQKAKQSGFYKDELLAVEVPNGRDAASVITEDEHPRPQVTPASLAKLKPLYADGVTTAGNASGINDGAVALMLGSAKAGQSAKATPRARILATAAAGVAPRLMGFGPVPAIHRVLERTGLSLSQIDVIEINEAFAAQVLACLSGLGLSATDDRINPNGGAIAIGHPLGASGPRLVLTAMRELERRRGRYAIASMCIGLGQGMAMVLERCE